MRMLSVEVLLPHRVEYLVVGPVSVADVIGTLEAQQKLIHEFGEIVDLLVDGLSIQRTELRVKSISSGSLKEAFFVAVFFVYQDELRQEVPALVEKWLNIPVGDSYDALVTVATIALAYYGADYAYRKLTDQLGSARIKRGLDDIVDELAHLSGKSTPEVRRIIEAHFKQKARLKELAKASIKFFRPSRNQKNDPILVGDRRIESDVIADVPNQVDLKALDAADYSVPMYGTRIELRAKDHDHDGSGWGGIVGTISEKRKPVRLYPTVSKDYLWQNDVIWADILVTYRAVAGGQEPIRYHIMKILDGPPDPPIEGSGTH